MAVDNRTENLRKLGLPEAQLWALTYLPLVHVAWSDGKIQPAERKLILMFAESDEKIDEEGIVVITRWLGKQPSRYYLRLGRVVLAEVARRGGPTGDLGEAGLRKVLTRCVKVADAAGGLFGLVGRIEGTERDAMRQIASELAIHPDLQDEDILKLLAEDG